MKLSWFILSTLLTVTSFAKECPDTMTIDQLPVNKTFIQVSTQKQYYKKNHAVYTEQYAAGDEIGTKKSIFKDDGAFREILWNWIKHPGRSIDLTYSEDDINHYKGQTFVLSKKDVKLDEPEEFKLSTTISIDFTKRTYIFQSKFHFTNTKGADLPGFELTPNRSILDYRQRKYITLGSLKYNLGSEFKVITQCD